jgi:hypothetical protein
LTDHDPGIYAEELRVSTGTPGIRPKGRAALERPPLHYAEVHAPKPPLVPDLLLWLDPGVFVAMGR